MSEFRNAATVRCRLGNCTPAALRSVEENILLLGADLEKYLEQTEISEGQAAEIARSLQVVAVFRMAGPDEYYIHCVATDLYFIEIFSNQLLRGHREIGQHISHTESTVGLRLFILDSATLEAKERVRTAGPIK